MKYLTLDEIIIIHDKLINITGGSGGLRDRNLLESAINSVFASFDDYEKYPTIEEKSARYAYAITNNHSFIDGNKRIGVLVMLMTLDLNRIELGYEQKELIALGLSIADGSIHYEEILEWIHTHKL